MFVFELYDPMRILRLSSFRSDYLHEVLYGSWMLYCADYVKVLGYMVLGVRKEQGAIGLLGQGEEVECNDTNWELSMLDKVPRLGS